MSETVLNFFGGDDSTRLLLTRSLEGLDELSDFQILLDSPSLRQIAYLIRTPRNRRLLVRMEAHSVNPLAYSWFSKLLFKRIADIPFLLPPCKSPVINWSRSEVPVLVQADKLSMARGELYSLRRRVIDNLPCTVFGPGWDRAIKSRISIFLKALVVAMLSHSLSLSAASGWFRKRSKVDIGVADKSLAISRHHVAIVIENDISKLTEKIYDALYAGCVPVFVGPDLQEHVIPSELYFRSDPSLEAIATAIEKAKTRPSTLQLELIRSWQEKACMDLSIDVQLSRIVNTILAAANPEF